MHGTLRYHDILDQAGDGARRREITHELLIGKKLILQPADWVESVNRGNNVALLPLRRRVNYVGCELLAEVAVYVGVHRGPDVIVLYPNVRNPKHDIPPEALYA